MTPKAEGSYFEPKHLEQTTLSYIHFTENAQAKPRQHYSMDNHKIVQVIQSDTTSYYLQDLDAEDVAEWKRVKAKNARAK